MVGSLCVRRRGVSLIEAVQEKEDHPLSSSQVERSIRTHFALITSKRYATARASNNFKGRNGKADNGCRSIAHR